MLVLSRKENETVLIGDNIEIKIVSIRGNRVRLAFSAPPEISVQREEVYQRVRAEDDAGRPRPLPLAS